MLKMIFSVQNNNLDFSVEFWADLKQTQVRETVCGFFSGKNGHLNPSLAHGGGDAQGFQLTSYNASIHDRAPTWRRQMMDEVAEHVRINYPETSDSGLKVCGSIIRRVPLSLGRGI